MSAEENKPAEAAAVAAAPEKGNGHGRRKAVIVLTLLVVAGIIAGGWLWYRSKVAVTTDDAFITAPIHYISARVPGQVAEVRVSDNQKVAAGDLLVALDPAVYQANLANAEAQLAMAKNQTGGDYARVAAARAVVEQARARLDQAVLDLARGEALRAKEVIPQARLDQLHTAHSLAQGSLTEAGQNLRRAEAELGATPAGDMAAPVARRAAEVAAARLNLGYTQIAAPVAGYVTRKSAEVGNNVQPGQPLLALVALDAPWIVANYKESQLTHLEPGQKVEFEVDSYPGRTFSGSVDSIMAGTGSAFSLLPPENATGNYVKVVQRVPVKIVIDPDSDPGHLLRVGMSVVPTIHTGRSFGDIVAHLNPFH